MIIKPLEESDKHKIYKMFVNLSEDTICNRYGHVINFEDARIFEPYWTAFNCAKVVLVAKTDRIQDDDIIAIVELYVADKSGDVSILVRDEHQSCGVGDALMTKIEGVAKELLLEELTAVPLNIRSKNLIKKHGFIQKNQLMWYKKL